MTVDNSVLQWGESGGVLRETWRERPNQLWGQERGAPKEGNSQLVLMSSGVSQVSLCWPLGIGGPNTGHTVQRKEQPT
jgi:hypothetical protein